MNDATQTRVVSTKRIAELPTGIYLTSEFGGLFIILRDGPNFKMKWSDGVWSIKHGDDTVRIQD